MVFCVINIKYTDYSFTFQRTNMFRYVWDTFLVNVFKLFDVLKDEL